MMKLDQSTPSTPAVAVDRPLMKAMVYDTYGPFDVLSLANISKPHPKDDELLVRVHAAGLHVGDCFGVKGSPIAMRLTTGLMKPKNGVPGFDFSGRVVARGEKVTRFEPGDKVFGVCNGACAEYTCVTEARAAPMPDDLNFEQAAAIPTSGLTALHALRDVAKVQPGRKVLINGASGGVGTFAVQIAKAFGAEVTGVCSARNFDMVRALGADHVIDYTREDFTLGDLRYDVILDNVENRSLSECRRVLTPNGTLILNSGTGARGIRMVLRLLKPLVVSPFVRQNLRRYLSVPNQDDLIVLKDLVEAKKLAPVLDKNYDLHETPAALRYIETGHARGKVVVTI